ncbi:MAG TPA: LuxR C-terminal-related transcriptional regulator, partial [Thermomicrobiales bacterium]
ALALAMPDAAATAEGDRSALFEVFRVAFAALAERQPLAILLDDLHWADSATLELLPALIGALGQLPLFMVAFYRSDEIPRGHPVRRLRSDLRRIGRFTELALEPLDREQTAHLVARTLGSSPDPALTAAIYDRTEGVPFFVEELVAGLVLGERLHHGTAGLELGGGAELPLPESVRDAVLLRLNGLSDRVRRALEVAAVLSQEFDIDLVAALAGEDDWATVPAERNLITEIAPGRAAFRHALTREACYLDVPWSRRRALHRQVAERLEADGIAPAIVAEHWLAGREPDRARAAFLDAAAGSCRVHAYRDAAMAVRRSLELWPEGTDERERLVALERLGRCAELCGELGEASQIWREIAFAYRQHGERYRMAVAERHLAGVHELQGDWERALAARQRAAAGFADCAHPAEAAIERLSAAVHLRSAAGYHAALELLAIAQAEAIGAARRDLQARILGLEGNVRARLGESDAGLTLVRAGLALALEDHLTGAATEVYHRLADALEHVGDYTGAQAAYQAAFAFCQTHDAATTGQLCLACLTVVLRQTGDWEQATVLCREVLAADDVVPHARAVASAILGLVQVLSGQTRHARPLFVEAIALARRIELVPVELIGLWGLALADEQTGSIEAAVSRCRTLLARWEGTEERHYVVPILHWAVTFCAEHDADGEARSCAAALAQIAAATGQADPLAALAHALGETALLDGDVVGAASHFGRAQALLRDRDTPFERAVTMRRVGATLVQAGERESGVGQLADAHRVARQLGAKPLAARIAGELAALGEPVERHLGRRAAGELAHGGLSRRERDVLQLIAVGRTSPEIGTALHVSPRTVEMHVQRLFDKLDCGTRAEAVHKAASLGLLP